MHETFTLGHQCQSTRTRFRYRTPRGPGAHEITWQAAMHRRSLLRSRCVVHRRHCHHKRRGDVVPERHEARGKHGDTKTPSMASALRLQMEFCCLLSGWDAPCGTCPFDWYGFDPKRHQRQFRERRAGAGGLPMRHRDPTETEHARKLLELRDDSFTRREVKHAFRVQALAWHPDCNPDPDAERVFKEIVAAYELLFAMATSDD